MTLTSGTDSENNMQADLEMKKRNRMESDNVQEGVSVRKRRASDDGRMPPKKMRCSNLTNPSEHGDVSVKDRISQRGKRKSSVDARPPEKKRRCSIQNGTNSDPSVIVVEEPVVERDKRKASNHNEAPKKKSGAVSWITISSDTDSSSPSAANVNKSGGDISLNTSSASPEEERIYEMSSSANTSRADFVNKYCELGPIGKGGFGSVHAGFCKSDCRGVAIKHIPIRAVRKEKVKCNGKVFNVIVEVALMLKTAGLPGSIGQSTAVSLLDWYHLDEELILVMERPINCMDLCSYLKSRGGYLDEHEAKMIMRQLVDAAIDMDSKGVFHRDIKSQNVLVQLNNGVPRVRIIDFGCGSLSTEMPHSTFCGTRAYFPPEWVECRKYMARPTTVWQLGVLFYSLLSGHVPFTTEKFMSKRIQFNGALCIDLRILLSTCLARDPQLRITLEELRSHLAIL
uniref:serine/threonine-protein kinase pim-2-like n=1 Tax=Scatophagus argus TaxID=75038 RepID=UPI001ED7ECC7|nr:serine/threonine-protein kinase pim-2-like [Scatophagus argus]